MKAEQKDENIAHRLQATLLDRLALWCSQTTQTRKRKLARLLTLFAYKLAGIRRRLMTRNLMLHLKLSQREAQVLAEKTFYNFLLNSFEMASLKYISHEDLLKKVKAEGLEHLDAALAKKKGAIIVSGHFGVWEFIPAWIAAGGKDVTIVVRRQNNRHVDEWFESMRHTHGPKTTDSGFGLRGIIKALRQGHILALMVDQDNGKQGIFVKFFEKYASAPVGPAQIALRTGAPIVPLAMFPGSDGVHRMKVLPPIYPEAFANTVECQQQITQSFTSELENFIRQQPQQWFWLHRRWKTQPEDAPDNPWTKLIRSL